MTPTEQMTPARAAATIFTQLADSALGTMTSVICANGPAGPTISVFHGTIGEAPAGSLTVVDVGLVAALIQRSTGLTVHDGHVLYSKEMSGVVVSIIVPRPTTEDDDDAPVNVIWDDDDIMPGELAGSIH